MEHNVLHEKLIGTPKKVEMLKQKALLKVETRVKEAKKKCLNFMEDVKHYNQTLIDMKKQLACILGASQATQMEAKLVHIQVEYHDNWRF
jgi:hypothetical protein